MLAETWPRHLLLRGCLPQVSRIDAVQNVSPNQLELVHRFENIKKKQEKITRPKVKKKQKRQKQFGAKIPDWTRAWAFPGHCEMS